MKLFDAKLPISTQVKHWRDDRRCRKYQEMRRKADRLEDWHRWFAWRPVHCNGAYRWLETVERRYSSAWVEELIRGSYTGVMIWTLVGDKPSISAKHFRLSLIGPADYRLPTDEKEDSDANQ